jgi:hypothetical protein
VHAALTDPDLAGVDPRRLDRYPHLPRAGDRILDVPDLEDIDSAIVVEPDRSHRIDGSA